MSKRKQRREAGSSWLNTENTDETGNSLEDVTIQGYGLDLKSHQQRIVARSINIFDIYPDISQPRRAVPSTVRAHWDETPAGVSDMLVTWWNMAQQERAETHGDAYPALDLGRYLDGLETERSEADSETETAPTLGPVEASFMKLITLAASIRRDGLTNAVTVAPMGDQFRLETGERRWLAYHLLYAWFDGTDDKPNEQDTWGAIPARKVDRVDVWRQASENNARDDLNAIGKARQYAVLMMDMHGIQHFKPLRYFDNERDYYAQVAGVSVPYGRGEELLNAMGVSSRSVLTRLRSLLQLPDEIWEGGDDYNLPEDLLVQLSRLAQKDEKKAIEKYRQTVLNQNNSTETTTAPRRKGQETTTPGTREHFTRLIRQINKTGKGRPKDNAAALKGLRELRTWLEQEEERINNYFD